MNCEYITSIPKGLTEDIELIANWEREKYNITLLDGDQVIDVLVYESNSIYGNLTILNKDCYVFYSNGISPREFTDDIYARAYAEVDGEIIYSEVLKYSVLEYYHETKEEQNKEKNYAHSHN